jgi:hypothetical protein
MQHICISSYDDSNLVGCQTWKNANTTTRSTLPTIIKDGLIVWRSQPIIKIHFRLTCIVFAVLTSLAASAPADGKLPVFVSIAPQRYFVQQIGRDLVDVQLMVQPGADPHTYEPKPKQMVAITKASLYE